MALPAYTMNQASFPQMYERLLVGPLFRPWAETILDELKLSPGDRVLDIACGTGIVARVAKERLGHAGDIVGVDVSPDMLAVARAADPSIDWREGNAVALPLKEKEQFDVVVCQQGLQFFSDKMAAAAQMRRALRQGGKLAVAVWRSDEEIPFLRELRRVAEGHLGAIADQRHSFSDAAALEALLRNAGFRDVQVKTLRRTTRVADGAAFLRLNTMALVGMSTGGKTMPDGKRKTVVDAIIGESAPILSSYADGTGIAFELGANLATSGS
jgi:ubiquinone/menaquinone biosynthesis C-methylase UbiE